MSFRVEVRPAWPIFPGEPGAELWAPVLDDPSECEFETIEPARALQLVTLFFVRRVAVEPFRELRIHEVLSESV